MARFTFKLARKSNPTKQIGAVTVIGKSLKAAKSTAGKLLGAMNRGLTKTRATNKRRPARRRQNKPLSFGQRMARLRLKRGKRKSNKRRRVRR